MTPRPLPENCWLDDCFLNEEFAEALLEQLIAEVNWRQDEIFIFGRWTKIPRLQNFMGDKNTLYTYSGLQMNASDWHPQILNIKSNIEARTGQSFNAALLNQYRDGNDSMGWHRDNEPELGSDPIVASVSLGAARRFIFREIQDKSNKSEILLTSGSLLWMGPGTQLKWQHSVPKTKRCHTARVNITFRQIQSS
ncbi:MAG: alpha-ketoglutarate-dependent dioxygenase AlkB family protein [Neptuniibacter sp.]